MRAWVPSFNLQHESSLYIVWLGHNLQKSLADFREITPKIATACVNCSTKLFSWQHFWCKWSSKEDEFLAGALLYWHRLHEKKTPFWARQWCAKGRMVKKKRPPFTQLGGVNKAVLGLQGLTSNRRALDFGPPTVCLELSCLRKICARNLVLAYLTSLCPQGWITPKIATACVNCSTKLFSWQHFWCLYCVEKKRKSSFYCSHSSFKPHGGRMESKMKKKGNGRFDWCQVAAAAWCFLFNTLLEYALE